MTKREKIMDSIIESAEKKIPVIDIADSLIDMFFLNEVEVFIRKACQRIVQLEGGFPLPEGHKFGLVEGWIKGKTEYPELKGLIFFLWNHFNRRKMEKEDNIKYRIGVLNDKIINDIDKFLFLDVGKQMEIKAEVVGSTKGYIKNIPK